MDEVERSRSRACRMATDMMEIENLIRYAPLAVGLMEIEQLNPLYRASRGANGD